MISYIIRRLLLGGFVLWGAASLAFLAVQVAPGDPAQVLLAASGASQQEIALRRAWLGLDQPVHVQYLRYIADLLRGRLGYSWLQGRPVSVMILEQAVPTLELALVGALVGTVLGLTLGTLAALRRGSWLDTLTTALAVIGLSTPTYWTGLLAILLFSLYLRWLPTGGTGGIRYLVLPASVLGLAFSGSVARLVRVRVGEVLALPFITAARARGLPAWRVILVHVLRPAIAPVLTVIALQLGFLLSGAVVTETIFVRPGLGKLMLQAILWRDLPVVRGVILVAASAYVFTSLGADLLQAWLDPRVRDAILVG